MSNKSFLNEMKFKFKFFQSVNERSLNLQERLWKIKKFTRVNISKLWEKRTLRTFHLFFFASRVNKEFFNLFFTDFEGSTFHEQISGDMEM